MSSTAAIIELLDGLDEASLNSLLERRAFFPQGPRPRSIAELAIRLEDVDSVVGTLRQLPVPCLQLAEAIVALGSEPSFGDLVALTAADDPALVSRWLDVLRDCAIAWRVGSDAVARTNALDAIFASPLGLGPALDSFLEGASVDTVRRILSSLGKTAIPMRRTEVVQLLYGLLTDDGYVRRLVQTAPEAVRTELAAWARVGRGAVTDSADDDSHDDPPYVRIDRDAYQRRALAAQWAVPRGLVWQQGWSWGHHVPAEVTRALRGPDFRAPYTPTPPAVSTVERDLAAVENRSAAAVSTFAELTMAVVDRLARTPLPALKSGGVGGRELAKLGKLVGCDERSLRLVLGLCESIELLEWSGGGQWTLAADAQQWRAASPADRMAELLAAWWQLPYVPGELRDIDDKIVPALRARPCQGCLMARQLLLQGLASLAEGLAVGLGDLAQLCLWQRPFVHILAQDAQAPFATTWAEATELGLVVGGCLSSLGRAVLAEDAAVLHGILESALPEANNSALFGADLTVVVTGSPTLAISTLLDAAADRESRGAATVWRFTPGSIRRALDEGHTAGGLEQALTKIATTRLPQALRYLIADIGRQHGNLRVSDAVSVIRSDDAALLQQVAADRSLRKLGFRLLGPTVLSCEVHMVAALAALRKAGYLPMPDSRE